MEEARTEAYLSGLFEELNQLAYYVRVEILGHHPVAEFHLLMPCNILYMDVCAVLG